MNGKLTALASLAAALCIAAASDAMAYKRNDDAAAWKKNPTELAGGYGRLQPYHGGAGSMQTADRKLPARIGYTNPEPSHANIGAQPDGMNYAGESTMAVDNVANRPLHRGYGEAAGFVTQDAPGQQVAYGQSQSAKADDQDKVAAIEPDGENAQ